MKPLITDLQNSQKFNLMVELDYSDPQSFMVQWLKTSSLVTRLYSSIILVAVACTGAYVGVGFARTDASVMLAGVLSSVGWAVIASLTVVLLMHEFIHASVYKLLGAEKIGFGASWKKFIVYAYADKFVTSKTEFFWVALTPFLIISTLCLMIVAGVEPLRLFGLCTLSLHGLMCAGDVALINYLYAHKDQELYTYDDASAGKSYIYAETAS